MAARYYVTPTMRSEIGPAERRVMVLAERLSVIIERSPDSIIDSYGIGHLLMCRPQTLKIVADQLQHRLDQLLPPRNHGSNWKTQTYDRFRKCFPNVSACYAFYCDGQLVYVGSSLHLRNRMIEHRVVRNGDRWETPWGFFKSVIVKFRPSIKYGDWAMVELRLLRRLKPIGNTMAIEVSRHG